MGDFETTVYEGQAFTEVWASALVEIGSEDVLIHQSIKETFDYLFNLAKTDNIILYYHNLKFDGAFILDYLIRVLKWNQAFEYDNDGNVVAQTETKYMKNKTFKYLISEIGQWYSITIKVNKHFIEIRDSLKLLPFSVAEIGKAFDTKHKKLSMNYEGFRYAGCNITDEEKEYIKNDVLVVAEALKLMFDKGHNKLTIGSCCLQEFKRDYNKEVFSKLFPNLVDYEIDKEIYGSSNADVYVRNSYKGGWCYLVKGKEDTVYTNGITLDVNSLYPSMMSSESGNYYPVGLPTFWSGDYIPDEALNGYYFIRIKTQFNIKRNKLPFIQIKGNSLYKETECLTSSDIVYKGKRYKKYERNGEIKDTSVILTLTQTDYELIKDHYNLIDCTILDGCYFDKTIGLFDNYINKYKDLKLNAKTKAERTLSKLYLNNLYGKLATNVNSSFKFGFYDKEEDKVGFIPVSERNKKPVYIPCGSAITSYARNFTIRTAQQNYHGVNHRGFIYADTDSIHCDLSIEEVKGVILDDKNFCCWKHESNWDEAIFVRQKTYIEHIENERGGEYDIKCAGMPQRCKDLFIAGMTGEYNAGDYNDLELDFIKKGYDITSFEKGLVIPTGKLIPKRITGGTILIDTSYEIR